MLVQHKGRRKYSSYFQIKWEFNFTAVMTYSVNVYLKIDKINI